MAELTWKEAAEDGVLPGDTIRLLPPQIFRSEDGTKFRVRDSEGYYSDWVSVELLPEEVK